MSDWATNTNKGRASVSVTKQEQLKSHLKEACEKGHHKKAKELSEALREQEYLFNDFFIERLLLKAAKKGKIEIVRLMIELGAELNDSGVGFPLLDAAEEGHDEIVSMLIKAGADLNGGDHGNPLYRAIGREQISSIRILIEAGANLNARTKPLGIIPLSQAAYIGNAEIMQLLIDAGIDLTAKSKIGPTPIEIAMEEGHHAIVSMIEMAMMTGSPSNLPPQETKKEQDGIL